MKKLLSAFCLMSFFISSIAFAGNISGDIRKEGASLENVRLDGFADLKNMKFHSLAVNGHLRSFDIKIDRRLDVNGSADVRKLKCRNFIIHGSINGESVRANEGIVHGTAIFSDIEVRKNIDIYGSLSGKDMKVSGKTNVYGNMSVENSKFGDVQLESETAHFIGTNVRNIVIKASKKHKKQTITLKGNTIISGSVIFESGNGEIIMDDTAKILGEKKGCAITSSK